MPAFPRCPRCKGCVINSWGELVCLSCSRSPYPTRYPAAVIIGRTRPSQPHPGGYRKTRLHQQTIVTNGTTIVIHELAEWEVD